MGVKWSFFAVVSLHSATDLLLFRDSNSRHPVVGGGLKSFAAGRAESKREADIKECQ